MRPAPKAVPKIKAIVIASAESSKAAASTLAAEATKGPTISIIVIARSPLRTDKATASPINWRAIWRRPAPMTLRSDISLARRVALAMDKLT